MTNNQILVYCTDEVLWNEWQLCNINSHRIENINTNMEALYIFDLSEETIVWDCNADCVVFKNSQYPLKNGYLRINAWPGFINRNIWETDNFNGKTDLENLLNKKIITAEPNEIGFVSTRIISSIINEALIAYNEKISDISSIDLAMILGTNYPKGPFEWANIIGYKKIYELLKCLSEKNEIYKPSNNFLDFINEKI